jgi:hypothetical protein
MGIADILSAKRGARDYGRNLAWQQYLGGAPLQSGGAGGRFGE